MSENNERSIRILPFNGKQENWSIWEEKFLARAKRKGYKNILLAKEVAPKDSVMIDTSTSAGKEQMRQRDANELAFEELILSIEGKSKAGRVAFALSKAARPAIMWMEMQALHGRGSPRSMPQRTPSPS